MKNIDINKMSDKEIKKFLASKLSEYDDNSIMRELIDENKIFMDIMKASENKRSKYYVKKVIGEDFDNVFDNEDNLCLKTIRNIQCIILTDSFKSKKHEPVIVNDKSSNKERKIIKPDFADEQIIHHALVRIILPRITKGMYKYTCASIPERGIHYAKKHVENAIINDPKNCKYVLKMDIRKFFDSIPHRILKKRLRNIIKEPEIRNLLFKVIDTTEIGLPLGFYTSQWLANFYLQPLDHYIKEKILCDCNCNVKKTHRYGAVHYFRYMDDMVIFGPNKKELHKMKDRIEYVLNNEYGLRLKYDWQVFKFDYVHKKNGKRTGRPLDFVGFQFYSDHTIIRKRNYKKILKLIRKLREMDIDKIPFHDAASMLSYYGFIYWSDAKGLYKNFLKPYVRLKDLKNIIKKEYIKKQNF